MSNLTQIIKEIDGVDFYVDTATGKGGVSQRSLAVLCGVDEKSVRNALNSIRTFKPYKGLESFVHKYLQVRTQTESGMWLCNDELSVALIRYYDRKGNATAQFTFDKFAVIGFNVWVQTVIGCQSEPIAQTQTTQPQALPVVMPTTGKLEYMRRSRTWEQEAMARWLTGGRWSKVR